MAVSVTYPWEQLPTVLEAPEPPAVADPVTLLQRDFAFAVQYTAVMVHSTHDELKTLVNTPRGQTVPRGECKFTDGSTFELQDIGMPQPGAPTMTVQKLMAYLWDVAKELGLELQ